MLPIEMMMIKIFAKEAKSEEESLDSCQEISEESYF